MMRQAGRHMQVYRDLVKKYPTFRERSEISEVSTEISLQPVKAYGVDGCVLFSDILTPLPGMGVEFDIKEAAGPALKPLRTKEQVDQMIIQDDWSKSMPFVKQSLGDLRKELGSSAAVLGFVGLPYTMATYLVEGGTSKEYLEIKKMMYSSPEILHKMLETLAENIGNYANYQVEAGAHIIQIFDSWAGHLAPDDYDIFALPYQKMVVDAIKAKHPDVRHPDNPPCPPLPRCAIMPLRNGINNRRQCSPRESQSEPPSGLTHLHTCTPLDCYAATLCLPLSLACLSCHVTHVARATPHFYASPARSPSSSTLPSLGLSSSEWSRPVSTSCLWTGP
jgi:hypothetical protein